MSLSYTHTCASNAVLLQVIKSAIFLHTFMAIQKANASSLPRTSPLILLNFVVSFKILPVHLYLQETSPYSGVIPMQLPSSVCIPILLYISFLQFLFYDIGLPQNFLYYPILCYLFYIIHN